MCHMRHRPPDLLRRRLNIRDSDRLFEDIDEPAAKKPGGNRSVLVERMLPEGVAAARAGRVATLSAGKPIHIDITAPSCTGVRRFEDIARQAVTDGHGKFGREMHLALPDR